MRDRPLQYTVLADEIQNLESEGMLLSSDWFRFEAPTSDQLVQLQNIVSKSVNLLHELSASLDHQLKTSGSLDGRTELEYAYNLVQELIQSRMSVLELIGTSSQDFHPEFCRALAIKEKAAADQAAALQQSLHTVIH